jgi:predicted HTH transcriptional regulator
MGMDIQNSQTFMDQRIFDLGLSTETISLYLLCTGLADSDKALTQELLRSMWNGSREGFDAALMDLEKRGILQKQGDPVNYRIVPSNEWAIH